MAVASARITAFLKSVADAGSDLLAKIAYGTPGSYVAFPESTPENEAVTGPRETGQVYPGVVIPGLLDQVGAEMDRAACVWAWIGTGATGVAPAALAGHINIASVSKNEPANTLMVTLSIPYLSGYYCHMTAVQPGKPYLPVNTWIDSTHFAFEFDTIAGGVHSINNLSVLAFACGQV